jgi:hypothetical protein
MDRLQIGAALGCVAVLGITALGFKLRRMHRDLKIQIEKQRQVQYRINKSNIKKTEAVIQLQQQLDDQLKDTRYQARGLHSLLKAQKRAEDIFYVWLNEHFDMFHIASGTIQITSVRNGFFQYELPPELKQFTKRKQR